jgi:hypothetical protein
MDFNTVELLLSNVGNLSSKTNKNNEHPSLAFDKILENIKGQFENIEINMNNLDGKNLPGVIKNQLLSQLEKIDMALKNLIGKEENFSVSEFVGKTNTSESSMFPVINSHKNETKGLFNSNKQKFLTSNYDLTSIAEKLKVLENSNQENNIERHNIFRSIKNRIDDLKAALTEDNLNFGPTGDKVLLQNIYKELKTIKSEIIDNLAIVKENEVESLSQKSGINEEIGRISNTMKAAIDNSIENLANIISPQNMEDVGISERIQQINPNLLALIEDFNKHVGQRLSLMHNELNNKLRDKTLRISVEKESLIKSLFDGDVRKSLLNLLKNEDKGINYSKTITSGSDFNFINPNKVDIAFKETFLENEKDKKDNNIKDKIENHENSKISETKDYRLLKRINANDKEQQVNKEFDSINKNQNTDITSKDYKTLNLRVDYMSIDTTKNGKTILNNLEESLQKNYVTKEIANRLTDYIKFIKQENISKAELRLNIEDFGKLKILFTDVGDKINARIYTDNDNVKHLVALAFDNIKDNLVQKGINLSQYDFYHLNKDNQENEKEQNKDERKNSYASKNIEQIEKKLSNINALYA